MRKSVYLAKFFGAKIACWYDLTLGVKILGRLCWGWLNLVGAIRSVVCLEGREYLFWFDSAIDMNMLWQGSLYTKPLLGW